MKVDIAVCTWNRADLLSQTLESFTRLNVPEDCKFRVIVIDNDSSDDTQAILKTFASRMNLATAIESQRGHTYSRNRAIAIADSQLMIWTDDDVIVDCEWLSSYVGAAKSNPECTFWGGRIIPLFDPPAEDWIADNWEMLRGCFAERDLGDDPIELNSVRLPYGANFAIRTAVQKQFAYDTNLGRRGHEVMGEDELDLFRRLLTAGHRGRWVPESRLQHVIPPERATRRYVFDYFQGQGKSLVAKGQPWSRSATGIWKSFLYERFMYRFKSLTSSSGSWLSHLIRSGLAKGQLDALKQAVRE